MRRLSLPHLLWLSAALGCSPTITTTTTTGPRHPTSGATNGGSASATNGGGTSSGSISTIGSSGTTGGSTTSGGPNDGGCDGDCPTIAPYCVSGECEECRANNDCLQASPNEPNCVTDNSSTFFGHCVACITSADCSPGNACDPTIYACVTSCITTPSNCTVQQHCETDSGACVQCLASSQCLPGQVCSEHSCGGCHEDSQCNPDGGLPFCNLEQTCVECRCPFDAGAGYCQSDSCDSGMCSGASFMCR